MAYSKYCGLFQIRVQNNFSVKNILAISISGQSKIPSLADDMTLEDDLDGGSEVGTQGSSSTSGIGSLPNNSDLASDLESNLMEGEDRGKDGGIEINIKTQNVLEEMELEGGAYSSIDIGNIEDEKSMSRSESAYSTTSLSEAMPSEDLTIPLDLELRKRLSDDKLVSQGEEDVENVRENGNEATTTADSEQGKVKLYVQKYKVN